MITNTNVISIRNVEKTHQLKLITKSKYEILLTTTKQSIYIIAFFVPKNYEIVRYNLHNICLWI